MLYIDQPTQVGFSYDELINGTASLGPDGETFLVEPGDFSEVIPESNLTHHVGTFSSQKLTQTPNTTAQAAHAFWHFAQTWFTEFPHYKPSDDRISLWAESYGGHYGPAFFHFLQQQNDKIANGSSTEKDAHYLHLDTLGIVDGLLDMVIQHESFISFPYNNTYGIQAINQSTYEELMHNWTRPGGCKAKVQACGAGLRDGGLGAVPGARPRVVRHRAPEAGPVPGAAHAHGYLRRGGVLSALGVPVNHSMASAATAAAFAGTFDFVRGGYLGAIAALLDGDGGVRVHLVYGDRDYASNWAGGEAASLAVPWRRAAEFAAASYAPLLTPREPPPNHGGGYGEEGGEGGGGCEYSGLTRQVGNFSFTRVFQAGHEVPSYAPGAAHAIFARAASGRDIATGLVPVTDGLVTSGVRDAWTVRNAPPERPRPRCYILKPESCLPEV
ncbi:putative serine carboxypeptidase [Rosellinia necatrix]|uniref:Carboxypeptidase n=1 Tax=Rosellinia necatrix TaxID=77044 RepID=A0A1W2TSL9_ROSNE|nr:putative serine carboxypeptidase [Rosellinia necatrix]